MKNYNSKPVMELSDLSRPRGNYQPPHFSCCDDELHNREEIWNCLLMFSSAKVPETIAPKELQGKLYIVIFHMKRKRK